VPDERQPLSFGQRSAGRQPCAVGNTHAHPRGSAPSPSQRTLSILKGVVVCVCVCSRAGAGEGQRGTAAVRARDR
jgi:hypothetical protein